MSRLARRMWDLRPDTSSIIVLAGIVVAAWWLFGWSPVSFGLIVALVVVTIVAGTAVAELRAEAADDLDPPEDEGDADVPV